MGGSRFDALLGGPEVDPELRNVLGGVPGVTLPTASSGASSSSIPDYFSDFEDQAARQQQAQQQAQLAAQQQAQLVAQQQAELAARQAQFTEQMRANEQQQAMAAQQRAQQQAAQQAQLAVQQAAAQQAQYAAQQQAVQQQAVRQQDSGIRRSAAPTTAPLPTMGAYAGGAADARTQVMDAQLPVSQMYGGVTPGAGQSLNSALPDFSERAKPTRASRATEIEQAILAENPEADRQFIAAVTAIIDLGASDLHMVSESTPVVRLDGQLKSVAGTSIWDRERIESVIRGFVPAEMMETFERELELDLAWSVGEVARFRVNIFQDQRGMGAALRIIPTEIKSVAQLGLPRELVELASLPRGLVLVCGPTGSGKSTTLAAIIDKANSSRASHIITVEDPIEFLHHHKRGIINQREVGADTHSFSHALKHALRQDPDIILVGEMRDLETISTALTAAETGHLVFATLHTQDAGQTIDRIIDVYPSHQQAQVRTQLAATLRAVVVQTLIPRASGKGRAVATEVMFMTPAIQSLVRAGKTHQLRTALQAGNDIGMHTLDQDLARLVRAGDIEYAAAHELAQDVTEFDQLVGRRGMTRAAAGDMSPEGTRQSVGGQGGAH